MNNPYLYEPETTAIERAALLHAISLREQNTLRAVLRDLDRAEQVIEQYRQFLRKEGFGR